MPLAHLGICGIMELAGRVPATPSKGGSKTAVFTSLILMMQLAKAGRTLYADMRITPLREEAL